MTRKKYDNLVKNGGKFATAELMREFVPIAGHLLIANEAGKNIGYTPNFGAGVNTSFTLKFEPAYIWVTPTFNDFLQFGMFGFSPDPYLTPEPDPWYVRLGRAAKATIKGGKCHA